MFQPTLDFGKRIRDLTTNFVGREWLLREVDDFLQQESEHSLMIIGEPGIGKSAFAAHLTQTRTIHAYHFCITREGGTLDPVAFVRSLSYQLAHTLPDFASHLIAQEGVKIDASQEILQMHGGTAYNVYIERLIAQSHSADEAFQQLVREPLKTWALTQPAKRKVVLLVDALDEGIRIERHPNIPDLIDSARDLPASVYWLLTSRPGEYFAVFPGKRLAMKDESTENIEDVRDYVGMRLAEPELTEILHTSTHTTALGDELVKGSGGNFLYLHYMFSTLREKKAAGYPSMIPDKFPIGLDGVYREFLDRILKYRPIDVWRKIYRPVLGVLAVARESLDFDTLVNLSGVDAQEVSDVVSFLSQFLDIQAQDATIRYRIYHASFADFLNDRKHNPMYWIDPEHYHRRIADYYLSKYAESWSGCDLYGLHYLPAHMTEAGYKEDLYRLLTTSPDWMETKFKIYRGASAYADDLDLALIDLTDPLTTSQLLILSRLQVARQVVFSRVSSYTNDGLRTLVWLGRVVEASDLARLRSDPTDRFWGLFIIYDAMCQKGPPRLDLLNDAREASREIEDYREKLVALTEIAAALAEVGLERELESVLTELRQVARSAQDLWWNSMIALAMVLDQVGYKDSAAELFAESRRYTLAAAAWNVEPLIELVRALAQTGRMQEASALLKEARQVKSAIEDEHSRFQNLTSLVVVFDQFGLEEQTKETLGEIDQFLGLIQNPLQRASMLVDQAALLTEIGRDGEVNKVLIEANQMLSIVQDPVNRASALINLARVLALTGREEQSKEVFRKARQLLDASEGEPPVYKLRPFRETPKTQALSHLAEVLVQSEMLDEAKLVAFSIEDKGVRAAALRSWAEASARKGLFSEAEQVARTIENIQERARALEYLSMILIRLHRFIEAERIARSINIDDTRVHVLSYLASTMAYQGKKAEARTLFTELEKVASSSYSAEHHSWALLQVAMVLINNGYAEQAIVVLEKAKQSSDLIYNDEKHDGLLVELTAIQAQLQRFEEARKAADATRQYLHLSRALQKLAISLAHTGHKLEASAVFMEAAAVLNVPQDHPYSRAEQLRHLAVAATQAGCEDESQLILTEAKQVTWLNLQFMTLGGIVLNEWILTLIQVGNYAEAGEIARKLSIPAYKSKTLTELAAALYHAGRRDEAWGVFEEAWDAARSSSPEELIRLAVALSEASYEKEARVSFVEAEDAMRALQQRHDSPGLDSNMLIRLAEALTQSGYKEEARSIFAEAERSVYAESETNVHRAQMLGSLAKALASAGYFAEAKKAVYAIKIREPNFPRSLYLPKLALELVKSQRFAEAFALLAQDLPDLDQFLETVSEWSPAFEQREPGLAIVVLCEVLRIAGWVSPDWQEIYDLIMSCPQHPEQPVAH